MREIQAPTHCPSCASVLEWSNHLLYCRNIDCGSQASKKIEHFAKTMKIKGLGPSSIEKLGIYSINGLYELTLNDIVIALNSEKLAEKLYSEIQNSKSAPLNMLLPAFSIPLIGKTAASKLSTVCSNIFEINEDICERAGLGPKATENLLDWYHWDFLGFLDNLPLNFSFEKAELVSENHGVVCISGKLKSYKTKADAAEALARCGYSVKTTITKDVTILVNESGVESAKTQKARNSGIKIVTNLLDFLGEN